MIRPGKYAAVLSVTAQSALAYPIESFARSGFMLIVTFVFAQLWSATFRLSGRAAVAGYDLPRMVWYLVVTEAIILSCPRTFTLIDQEVKNGDIAYVLNRPYSYALFHYATYMGNGLLILPLNLAVGSALALALAGPPTLPVAAWPALLLCVLLAMSLNFAIEFVIGLLAFWFEDTYAFFWIYQKTVFTLGGLFLPLDLFPNGLRQVAGALPFTSISYGPGRLSAAFSLPLFATTAATQIGWLAAMSLLAAFVYSRAVRRLSVNGG